MGIKQFKPVTPSRRGMTVSTFEEITKTKPERSLTTKLKKNAGRNSYGRITVRHHGGGEKRKYRCSAAEYSPASGGAFAAVRRNQSVKG